MQQTSPEAYADLKESGLDKTDRAKVYLALDLWGPMTDQELARKLGYRDPNKVRPRRNELVKCHCVAKCGTKECSVTGKRAITWGAI